MATITKLPPELILDILGSFEDDKVTLCRLSLVSSFFVEAAQQLLSRHLVLSVDMPLDGCETSFDKIITLFNQKPHLSVHVQTLVLSSRHSGLESSKSILRALNLLNRVTSLRYLDLKNALILPLWDMSPLTSDPFLETNPLTRLTKLKLTSPWISWSGIAIFLYLPSLEHLSLVHLPSGHAPSTLSESRGKICPIRTLELSTWGGQSGTPLKSLLELTNKLEFLGLAMISSESFFLPSYTVLEISKALVPVRDTLKVLKVKGECSADAHPGSRLDLSGFKILEKVDVLSSLLFSARSADRSRDGLFKLLPRSLVELQIDFVGQYRIISSMPPATSVLDDWCVNWLTELATNKSTCYPNFRTLMLQERSRLPPRGMHEHFDAKNWIEFQMPEGLKLEFKMNAIALRCWTRREMRV